MMTVNANMVKKLIPGILLAISLSLCIVNANSSLESKVFAQNANISTSTSTPSLDTFSANGSISSLVFVTHNASKNNLDVKNATDLDNTKKFILSGEWALKVNNGKATDFDARFTKTLNDGLKWHTHVISNFKSIDEGVKNNNISSIHLTPAKSISMSGTADIKLNGTSTWNNVKMMIQIANGKTIIITPDNNATANHFQGQPIYGSVLSIKDATGKEMLGAQQKILQNLYK